MTGRRDGVWRIWVVGSAWVVGLVFAGMALIGFDPADGPWASVSPPNAPVTNPCGPAGAWLAAIVMQTLGWGWPIAYAATIVLVARQRRRQLTPGPLDLVGILCLTLTCATLSQLGGWEILARRGPAVGPGGYSGALIGLALTETLGDLGSGLILTVAAVAGIMFTQTWLILEPFAELTAWIDRRGWLRRFRRAGGQDVTGALTTHAGSIPWRDQPLLPFEPSEAEERSPLTLASTPAREWPERPQPPLSPRQALASRRNQAASVLATVDPSPSTPLASPSQVTLSGSSSDPASAGAGSLVRIGPPANAVAVAAFEPNRSLAEYEPPSLE